MSDPIQPVAPEPETPQAQPAPQAAPEAAPEPTTPSGDPITPIHGEPTARNAIERAFEKVERPRNPDGTFARAEEPTGVSNTPVQGTPPDAPVETAPEAAPEPETPFNAAPDRFSPDAKEAWAEAPVAVRAEVHRLQEELTNGLDKYRGKAEAYSEFEDFHQQLQQRGQRFQDVVAQYTGIENMLRQNPMQGLDQICRNLGTSLNDVAAHVLQQPQENRDNAEMNHLRQMNQNLQQQLGALNGDVQNIRNHFTQQTEQNVMQQINDFATANPRFTELEDHIGRLLETGMASNLQDAYSMAERLNPAPALAPAPAPTPAPTAQTQTGQLSPTGAPATGSDPADIRKSANPREALDNAFSRVFG